MSYDEFVVKVGNLVRRAEGVSARYKYDTDAGKFFAYCSDGTTVIGNPECLRVTVRWGSGHQTMAAI